MTTSVVSTDNVGAKLVLSDVTEFVTRATGTLCNPSMNSMARQQLESIVFHCLGSIAEPVRVKYAEQYTTQRMSLLDRFPDVQKMLQDPKSYGCIVRASKELEKVRAELEMPLSDVLNLNELEVGQKISSESTRMLIFALATLNLGYR